MKKRVFIGVLCIVLAFSISLCSGLYIEKSVNNLIFLAEKTAKNSEDKNEAAASVQKLYDEWNKRQVMFCLILGRSTEKEIKKELCLFIDSPGKENLTGLEAELSDAADRAGFSFIRIF